MSRRTEPNSLEDNDMESRKGNRIQASILALALLLPAGNMFAKTHHVRHAKKHHHYSRTRGTLVGAAAGALIDHRDPVTGAVVGGVIGNVVQHERSKH